MSLHDFEAGRRQGLRDAADILEQHHETTSNQPPYRYLSARRHLLDLVNSAFIEELRRRADLLS